MIQEGENTYGQDGAFDEEIAVRDLALGVYEADDDNDLLDEITATTGYDIVNIYYEGQLK